MKIEIEGGPEGTWVEAGDWFKSFVDLGVILGKLASSPTFTVSRLLLAVPKKEFVTAAISLGLSIEKYLDRETHEKEIQHSDLSNLTPGTLIRLEWESGPRDVTFQAVSETEIKGKTVHIVSGSIDGISKPYDTRYVKRISILPQGFPEGSHIRIKANGQSDLKTGAQNFWQKQEAPAASIFGDVSYFQEQISTRVKYEALAAEADSSSLTLGEAARIDFLSNNKYPHFVNIFEQVGQFPKIGQSNLSKVMLCDWVILDGNNATQRLSAREELIDKRMLAIVELGNPRNQEKAFDAFRGELNYYKSVDAEQQLVWNPPFGVNIWGWTR